MKKIAPIILAVLLLTACSSGLNGTWFLSTGQEDRGCSERFVFLDGNNVEIKDQDGKAIVATYDQVGKNQYKLDMNITAILVEMKRMDEKLMVKTGDIMCMYDQSIPK